jgi:hypothetical protein
MQRRRMHSDGSAVRFTRRCGTGEDGYWRRQTRVPVPNALQRDEEAIKEGPPDRKMASNGMMRRAEIVASSADPC